MGPGASLRIAYMVGKPGFDHRNNDEEDYSDHIIHLGEIMIMIIPSPPPPAPKLSPSPMPRPDRTSFPINTRGGGPLVGGGAVAEFVQQEIHCERHSMCKF